jgi:hypothetical protein
MLMADQLNYTVTTGIGAGRTLYQFTLTNTGDTGGTPFDLFLALPTDISNINTATIGTPAGCGDPSGGLLFFGPDVDVNPLPHCLSNGRPISAERMT